MARAGSVAKGAAWLTALPVRFWPAYPLPMMNEDFRGRVLSFLTGKRGKDGKAIGDLYIAAETLGCTVDALVKQISELADGGEIGRVGGAAVTQQYFTVEIFDDED